MYGERGPETKWGLASLRLLRYKGAAEAPTWLDKFTGAVTSGTSVQVYDAV